MRISLAFDLKLSVFSLFNTCISMIMFLSVCVVQYVLTTAAYFPFICSLQTLGNPPRTGEHPCENISRCMKIVLYFYTYGMICIVWTAMIWRACWTLWPRLSYILVFNAITLQLCRDSVLSGRWRQNELWTSRNHGQDCMRCWHVGCTDDVICKHFVQ